MNSDSKLLECIYQSEDLIRLMEELRNVPESHFSGQTAAVLRNIQKDQLEKMNDIRRQLYYLRKGW